MSAHVEALVEQIQVLTRKHPALSIVAAGPKNWRAMIDQIGGASRRDTEELLYTSLLIARAPGFREVFVRVDNELVRVVPSVDEPDGFAMRLEGAV